MISDADFKRVSPISINGRGGGDELCHCARTGRHIAYL